MKLFRPIVRRQIFQRTAFLARPQSGSTLIELLVVITTNAANGSVFYRLIYNP